MLASPGGRPIVGLEQSGAHRLEAAVDETNWAASALERRFA